jgi:hypothetical protein
MTRRELLSVRLCDLNVSIEGTWLEEQIDRVRDELAQRDLRFNPHFWLSDEWFSPQGNEGQDRESTKDDEGQAQEIGRLVQAQKGDD